MMIIYDGIVIVFFFLFKCVDEKQRKTNSNIEKLHKHRIFQPFERKDSFVSIHLQILQSVHCRQQQHRPTLQS